MLTEIQTTSKMSVLVNNLTWQTKEGQHTGQCESTQSSTGLEEKYDVQNWLACTQQEDATHYNWLHPEQRNVVFMMQSYSLPSFYNWFCGHMVEAVIDEMPNATTSTWTTRKYFNTLGVTAPSLKAMQRMSQSNIPGNEDIKQKIQDYFIPQ